jgi:transposase
LLASSETNRNTVVKTITFTRMKQNHWLFFGDANAGERSAVIYSIIENCRRNEVEAGHRAISTPRAVTAKH